MIFSIFSCFLPYTPLHLAFLDSCFSYPFVAYWNENDRRSILLQFAKSNSFDPAIQENWHQVSCSQIMQSWVLPHPILPTPLPLILFHTYANIQKGGKTINEILQLQFNQYTAVLTIPSKPYLHVNKLIK